MANQSNTTNLCRDKGLSRRALLSKGAAAAALSPLAAVPALAANAAHVQGLQADAELRAQLRALAAEFRNPPGHILVAVHEERLRIADALEGMLSA